MASLQQLAVELERLRRRVAALSTGALDHGVLGGLGDDDHPHYLNNSRGDARYLQLTGGTVTGDVTVDASVTSDSYKFDTTVGIDPVAVAEIAWDTDHSTAELGLNGVTLFLGQELLFYVKNQTGSTINKGVVVRFDGALGASSRITIAPFLADGTYPSNYVMGVTKESIADGSDGFVSAFGIIRGLNTSAWAAGTVLYASESSAGGFTATEPAAPNNDVVVAAVVNQHATNGAIFVRPTFSHDLSNLEDVDVSALVNGNILIWDSSSSLWVSQAFDHGLLSGLADDDHTQYALADGSRGSGFDHGGLTGLGDDDHTQYLLADGTRTAASLTVSGDLTVDSGTLSVDSATDTVLAGTSTGGTIRVWQDASSGVSAIQVTERAGINPPTNAPTTGAEMRYDGISNRTSIGVYDNSTTFREDIGIVRATGTAGQVEFPTGITGDLGIGVSPPSEKVEIRGVVGDTETFLRVGQHPSQPGQAGIKLFSNGSGGRLYTIVAGDATYSLSGGLHFLNNVNGHLMTLNALGTNLGAIGIGNTAPAYPLDISGAARVSNLYLSSSDVAVNASGTNEMRLNVKNSADSSVDYLRVIAENANELKLIAAPNDLEISNIQTGGERIRFDSSGTGFISATVDSGERIRITNTGLGIGTTSPTEALDVSGNATISGTLNVSGAITGLTASATTVFVASTSTDFHGSIGTTTDMAWTATTNNGTYISSFTNGDTEVVANGDQEWNVSASVLCLDSTANNRSSYVMFVRHENSSSTELFSYVVGGSYIRDDAANYDSGGMGGTVRLFVSNGDRLKIRVLVLDAEDGGAGTAPAFSTYSKFKIDTVSYS